MWGRWPSENDSLNKGMELRIEYCSVTPHCLSLDISWYLSMGKSVPLRGEKKKNKTETTKKELVNTIGNLKKGFTQSCSTLCNAMDCSLPGSSVRGIFQARVLEWVAIFFSRRSSQPRDRTQVSHIAGRRFTIRASREDSKYNSNQAWIRRRGISIFGIKTSSSWSLYLEDVEPTQRSFIYRWCGQHLSLEMGYDGLNRKTQSNLTTV